MIRSQQSEDENENQGFFKPQQKVVHVNPLSLNQIQINQNDLDVNAIVSQGRPNDYKARIMSNFSYLNPYPQYLLQNKSQLDEEQLIGLKISSQRVSQKYMTLQQKYLNSQKYKLIYSKIPNLQEFNNYIFSLNHLADYNDKHYINEIALKVQDEKNGSQEIISEKQNQNEQNYLKFDSNFESGNLLYAFQDLQETKILTYDLIIQNDTNTRGYNQWFYFSIEKIQQTLMKHKSDQIKSSDIKEKTIKIRIVNFIKKHLMFQDGVRPLAFFQSEKEWKFIGRQVRYKKSYIKRHIQFNGSNVTKNFYTLSFLLDFPEKQNSHTQKVFIALNYPYPYKRAIQFIDQIVTSNTSQQIRIIKQTLCRTISNNQVPYLVIQSKPTCKEIQQAMKEYQRIKGKQKEKLKKQFLENDINTMMENDKQQMNEEEIKSQILNKRKKIILIARQHPGQTVGSFVLEGFLNHLLAGINQKNELNPPQSSQQGYRNPTCDNYQKLLKQYSIYVFPMINVDGVIYGNFRTNLAGFDLNRQWSDPNKWLQPEIYFLKKFVSTLKNIQFVLDFHGHSRKLNSFIYACRNPVPILLQNEDQNNYPNMSIFRLYPYILSKRTQLFSIKDCTYTLSRDKIKTARINTFTNLEYNPYVFTLETGFYGYSKGDKKFRYRIKDFYEIGKAALQSLKIILLSPKKTRQILKEVQNKSYLFDMWAYQNKEDPGSESNPSQDQLNPIEIKTKVMADHKLKQKQKIKNEVIKVSDGRLKRSQKKKQRRKIFYRKADTELKSQRTILKVDESDIHLILEKKEKTNGEKIRKDKIDKSQKQKRKGIKIEYLLEKKRNLNNELFNVVPLKEAMVQKPQFHLPQSQSRQKVVKTISKHPYQDFKNASNLLGAGNFYYQHKLSRLHEHPMKVNPMTLDMLQVNKIRRDIRIKSSVQVTAYEYSNMRSSSKQQESETKIKDLFLSLNKARDKNRFSRQSQGQKIFVDRQNRIVKCVENVNKTKSQSAFIQNQLYSRHRNLKRCQEMMSSDNKILIEEIKDQKANEVKDKRVEEKMRKMKVFLNPIQY